MYTSRSWIPSMNRVAKTGGNKASGSMASRARPRQPAVAPPLPGTGVPSHRQGRSSPSMNAPCTIGRAAPARRGTASRGCDNLLGQLLLHVGLEPVEGKASARALDHLEAPDLVGLVGGGCRGPGEVHR